MAQTGLHNAKNQKKDEFYTQLEDIEKELKHYKDKFRGKVVFCNCDDPYESNFFRYFVLNFNSLELKQLITTSYKPSPIANTQLGLFGDNKTVVEPKGRPKVTANKFIINETHDVDGDGAFNLKDVAEQLRANKNNEWAPLVGDGDFRSAECVELLKEVDVVVTNPPFSLFREYVTQLISHEKKFLIIGNINAITYREIFPLIKEDKMWIGESMNGSNRWFQIPNSYNSYHKIENGKKYAFVAGVMWFTNLDTRKRHENLTMYKKYTPGEYPHYENIDAIDVSKVNDIPIDWEGIMGVPISFVNKYNPDQFEIIGLGISNSGIEVGVRPYKLEHKKYRKEVQKRGAVDGDLYMITNGVVDVPYARILIKQKLKNEN